MESQNLDKNTLKGFGITMCIALLVITLLILIKHRHSILPTCLLSAVFFILSLTIPNILKPVYILWMRFAYVLGWINTRLILAVLFYVVFMPIGLAMRLFRVDLLDRKINKNKESYWIKKGKKIFNPLDYEHQF